MCSCSSSSSSPHDPAVLMDHNVYCVVQAWGVMITASHNPASDNGVKLVEPSGEMLAQHYETHATSLAQAETDDDVVSLLKGLAEPQTLAGEPGKVIIGRDTRPSGPVLVAACAAGVTAIGVQLLDIGAVTTPELHHTVQTYNQYGALEEQAYFTNLLESFRTLTCGHAPLADDLHVDCANGVGAQKLQQLEAGLHKLGLQLQLYNVGEGQLNHLCGADYVQKQQRFPAGLPATSAGARCASIDGDADRIVFFTKGPDGQCVLLDGDKIAALAAVYVVKLISRIPGLSAAEVSIGVVQTAYANGASTSFLRDELRLQVACTNTGVKYLHHEAKLFDIGIYFESNGHGTVLFKPSLLQRLQDMDGHVCVMQLLAVSRLMNQAVGDALSNLLLVEAVLQTSINMQDWIAMYKDLPSRQLKVHVADRHQIVTTDAERSCVSPAGMQESIDAVVAEYPHGRAFARPSGTEDVVRIYAEADTQEAADSLARRVAGIVYDKAGGIGSRS
eukprot:GHRR01021665.1.p1 GENE.GHRR01021665.1~~GHRR01021665.1.p1  ORF type:complete len:503 (+),score=168.16 GHRR01021665.1:54-1562(+)